jgi:prophage maintenance system killer protein
LLLRAICEEHPFADGNKRTGFEAAETFLRRNGARITATPEEAFAFVFAVGINNGSPKRANDASSAPRRKKLDPESERIIAESIRDNKELLDKLARL